MSTPEASGRIAPIWELREPAPDAVAGLRAALDLDELTARLLVNRGVATPEEARRFLDPRLSDMPDPFLMKGMEAAVTRIVAAIAAGEVICVWGDYDVDGVTSATQLLWFFRDLGVPVRTFVPDRFTDGYGLSGERLRELARDGVTLFITVDCGISAWREVEIAREEGADVVIVDHHQVPEHLPEAAAVLDPHQVDCAFPDKRLAACGVTWMLLVALRSRLRDGGRFADAPQPDLRRWLDLTAIGTVADMVPLMGLNRVIVTHGLARIARSDRPGVQALCHVSGLEPHRITAGRIGFHLGPRINAAGRVAHASAGLELLGTEDHGRAAEIAKQVDAFNGERRGLQEAIFASACELAERGGHPVARRTIVLAHPDWHPGVLGIVASKLVERYHRPTVLMHLEGGWAKGSARSIRGFKLVAHLDRIASLIERYGGHDHAAGLTVAEGRVDAFRDALEAQARGALQEHHLVPKLRIDAEVPVSQAPYGLVERLARLAPYGMGNPEPSLIARAVTVVDSRRVGSDQSHLKLTLEDRGVRLDAIAFGLGHQQPAAGARIDIVYVPETNVFRGSERLQLRIKALKISA
jgi:single-stranded-DNA-specific exonuclease